MQFQTIETNRVDFTSVKFLGSKERVIVYGNITENGLHLNVFINFTKSYEVVWVKILLYFIKLFFFILHIVPHFFKKG